ncbi:MAG: hypothetical protein ACREBG_02400 [Pyrinomonadaceae bacterium]
MEPTSSAIGLIVIVALYISIGVMSAAGSVYISKSIFSAKVEQIFFGLFLIPIAGFYLAFTAHFGDKDAWQLEATAVAVFTVFGLVGVRVPFALIVGYLLHGLWDAVHEFNAQVYIYPNLQVRKADPVPASSWKGTKQNSISSSPLFKAGKFLN